MKAVLDGIRPEGIYTTSQAIEITGMCQKTFYNWVKSGKIPCHLRLVDNRKVFKGHELIRVLTHTIRMAPCGWGETTSKSRRGKAK